MHLGPLVLIFAAALLGPVIAHTTRGFVPVVVAQTLLGVALGVTGLGVLDASVPELKYLDTLGFATLMFTVGMHVPLHDQRLRPAARRGLRATALVIPLATIAGWALGELIGGPELVYAVIIGSSSAAIALPLINERQLEGSSVLAATVWIIAADICAMVAIPLVLEPGEALRSFLGALAVAGLGAVILVAAKRGKDTTWVHDLRQEGKRREWAIDLRAAVLTLVTLSFVATEAGTSILVAGFLTGLMVGAIGGPKRLSREVLGLGQGFLIPIFFVLLGAKVDLRAMASQPSAFTLMAALLVATITVHVLVSRAIRAPLGVGLLASAQVGVPAAVIALGLPLGVLDQAQASAILCAAVMLLTLAGGAARLIPRPTSGAPPVGRPTNTPA